MPTGKRADNKVHVGCYIDIEIREMCKEILRKQGVGMSSYIYYCLLKLLNKSADEIIRDLKSSDGRTTEGKARNNKRLGKYTNERSQKKASQ